MVEKSVMVACYGVVQGVNFRYYTQQQAKKIGLNGWVANHQDGHVLCHLCGTTEQVDEMLAWLHEGPPSASVTKIQFEDAQWQSYQGFEITADLS